MAYHWSDNVHTTAFTPRDYQVELLAAARERNILICLGHNSSREFIALKLIQELAFELRQNNSGNKVSLYLTNDSDGLSAYNLIENLTDLKVCNMNTVDKNTNDWENAFIENNVIIANPSDCLDALVCGYLKMDNINLIIIENCHRKSEQNNLLEIFANFYKSSQRRTKVLGLAGPLHNARCSPGRLAAQLEQMEKAFYCKIETASDIVTVLRYCTKPNEFLLQCAPLKPDNLINFLNELVYSKISFLSEHRYDPLEIYSEEFLEEIQAIPDPKIEPLDFLNNYLAILNEMGPWCADRAAYNFLMQIEKQKVKTPYERHYMLLCMVSSTFVQIRAHCDWIFQQLPTEKERIENYSSPKVLRLLEILKLFKPDDTGKISLNEKKRTNLNGRRNLQALSEEIENLDFKKLEINLHNTVNDMQNNREDENTAKLIKNIGGILSQNSNPISCGAVIGNSAISIVHKSNRLDSETTSRNSGSLKNRQKRKYFGTNRNKQNNNSIDPESLCGIVFCNDKNTAKILYHLLYEASRSNPDLKFLNVQFTVDRIANPLTEAKEAEIEHRKQEEVLKRFRMHECNLLIGTSVLEEGIDLPKCNLVVRWDLPKTYRSYVQCKGRARAPQANYIILVAPEVLPVEPSQYIDKLSNRSHRYICAPPRDSEECSSLKSDSQDETVSEINVTKTIDSTSTRITENQIDNHVLIDPLENIIESFAQLTLNVIEKTTEDESTKQIIEYIPKGEINKDSEKEINEPTEKEPTETVRNESEKDISTNYSCVLDLVEEFDSIDDTAYQNGFEKMEKATKEMVYCLGQYIEIEKMLLQKCTNSEPLEIEQEEAERFSECIIPYRPLPNVPNGASVNLSNAVALINKYCAKLPSDTFTKLTPLWRCAKTIRQNIELYQYTIRLPINSPLKEDIQGLPMPTKVLARRMAALVACKTLHDHGELDDELQPIGKEGFKAAEADWEDFELECLDKQIINENLEPRPGTTKRRQYYYKRIASAFSNCRPTVGTQAYLYHIKMTLECPIPEEQNTRGRKIYPPEDAAQGFGIITLKKIPQVSSFPIFTRSGEVCVSLELSSHNVKLNETQIEHINTFLNYTFTNVLRLQKFLMLFDPESSENCFFIAPTLKNGNSVKVDWEFLKMIYNNSEKMPKPIPDEVRKNKEFDANKFRDAVVMPWYRNQDQPQYFYVAEICNHLSPQSSFPGENYSTFKEYYLRKYGLTIQNLKQPLLDVDHTSARLNFLTPRYVNRKGVALPTSSEETKRAKRENLEQKQILVPELCTIHPFPASLWRAAVCLPCILYRINALLLADEIRKKVSFDLGVGRMEIEDDHFEWPILDFGWSLAEVLKKSREAKLVNNKSNQDNKISADNADNTIKENEFNDDNRNKDDKEHDSKKSDENGDIPNGKTVNDLLEEVDEKLKSECLLEIGTWSNEMAESIDNRSEHSDNDWGLLPSNVNICSRNKTNIRYGSPTSWDVSGPKNDIENYYADSDGSYQSDDDFDTMSIQSNGNQTGALRIEFKSDNVAEAIETEEEIMKRQKQLAIIHEGNANEKNYQITKNLESGFDCFLNLDDEEIRSTTEDSELKFVQSVEKFTEEIYSSSMLIRYNEPLALPKKIVKKIDSFNTDLKTISKLIPYVNEYEVLTYLRKNQNEDFLIKDILKLSLNDFYYFNSKYIEKNGIEEYEIIGVGDVFDNFNDHHTMKMMNNEKLIAIEYKKNDIQGLTNDCLITVDNCRSGVEVSIINDDFSFDYQPELLGHPGPSPSIILQALTMSNANDGINLERLETIGDSFLKYAITTYLYCTYEDVHEGKLSHLRSKQVSNLNLYRLGRKKVLGECMIATKFEPHDNWLPPCYYVPKELEKALIEARIPTCHWNLADLPNIKELSSEEICELVKKKAEALELNDDDDIDDIPPAINGDQMENSEDFPCFIPYNLVAQHSIPDKSIADCVEALIGAYLIECGPRGALLFMAWLGVRVLPVEEFKYKQKEKRIPGSTLPNENNTILVYGEWSAPKSPLLTFAPHPTSMLDRLLNGFSAFEDSIGYRFRDRSYLLQAMTHASYSPNRLSDCYQRLEFLGDAVLDYLITRHLYEDPRQHSPGALTDLRSALVNNTIFASLAVRHGFHKYFRHLSPGLNEVIDRFVRIQHENGHSISEEYYLLSEEECDEAEDVEVPKALGDVFESVAGAIFLDSNMSLDTVWRVYSNMMRPEIEQFSNSVPKSPIRELLELEPETAKFSKPEKLADGRRVRVTVEVYGKGSFRGIGRNYRIAKCTAAKCALRQLKKQGLIKKKH